MGWTIVGIGVGAALGAWLRWGLALWLNPPPGSLPWGTLAANLLGGYLIGVAVGLFMQHPEWPQAWRAFVTTGLLGGLTTFSTFSVETVGLLMQGRWGLALAVAALHLCGSLLATVGGFASVQWMMRG